MSEFIKRYRKAESMSDKIKCVIAKLLRANFVSPLGRIILLPSDYEKMKKKYGENF